MQKINQISSYRRRELKYRTKAKCDDFKLWMIQIGIFVLYVKLVVRTMFTKHRWLQDFNEKHSKVSIKRKAWFPS